MGLGWGIPDRGFRLRACWVFWHNARKGAFWALCQNTRVRLPGCAPPRPVAARARDGVTGLVLMGVILLGWWLPGFYCRFFVAEIGLREVGIHFTWFFAGVILPGSVGFCWD
jgi:hypothetical protein